MSNEIGPQDNQNDAEFQEISKHLKDIHITDTEKISYRFYYICQSARDAYFQSIEEGHDQEDAYDTYLDTIAVQNPFRGWPATIEGEAYQMAHGSELNIGSDDVLDLQAEPVLLEKPLSVYCVGIFPNDNALSNESIDETDQPYLVMIDQENEVHYAVNPALPESTITWQRHSARDAKHLIKQCLEIGKHHAQPEVFIEQLDTAISQPTVIETLQAISQVSLELPKSSDTIEENNINNEQKEIFVSIVTAYIQQRITNLIQDQYFVYEFDNNDECSTYTRRFWTSEPPMIAFAHLAEDVKATCDTVRSSPFVVLQGKGEQHTIPVQNIKAAVPLSRIIGSLPKKLEKY